MTHEKDNGLNGSRLVIDGSPLSSASLDSAAFVNASRDCANGTRSDRARACRDRNLAKTWLTIDEHTTDRYPAVAARVLGDIGK